MIYGGRVRLRGMEKADLPQFVEWLNDPEVVDGLGMFLPVSMTDEEKWFEKAIERAPAEKPLVIDIFDGEKWRVVGSSSLFGIDWTNSFAEVGIVIGDKSVWNKGYGTETMRLLVKHGFETLNLNRIWLRVDADNLRAIGSYEKAGFSHEGRYRQGAYKKGKYIDILLMSILRDEWNASETK